MTTNFNTIISKEIFKYGLDSGQFPSILYKYRRIDQTILILENPALFFPSYKNLNDLFECYAYIDHSITENEMKAYIMRQGLNEANAADLARSIMQNPDEVKKITNEAIESVKSSVGILCLSASPFVQTMWNLYSDEYKGACIEFDLTKELNTFYFPKKVTYTDEIVSTNYIRSQIGKEDNMITEALFQKPTEWEKEKEWRVIKMNKADQLIPINAKCMVKLIFGPKANQDDITRIKNLVRDKGYTWITFEQIQHKPHSKEFASIVI